MNRKNPSYIRRKLGTTGIDLDPEKLNYVVLTHYANRYYSISGDVGIHFKVITYTFKDLDKMIHFYTEDPFEDLKLVYQNCKTLTVRKLTWAWKFLLVNIRSTALEVA
jgi:hypothetical protein